MWYHKVWMYVFMILIVVALVIPHEQPPAVLMRTHIQTFDIVAGAALPFPFAVHTPLMLTLITLSITSAALLFMLVSWIDRVASVLTT